jgi:hydroxyacylglutathione hydrolase
VFVIFQRFEDDGLAQFSYAVGSRATAEVAIVDPRRDVDVYLEFARDQGVRITHVLETHIHADYASGALELAARAGASLHASRYDRGERFQVEYAHQPLSDGSELRLGTVRLRAVHTPGHTPEHVSFLVFDDDEHGGDVPVRFLTGDFLLIGSLGRPDLLGEDERERLVGELFRSVRRVLPSLPDHLPVHPGHGAGSLCGAGMGDAPESTLGRERERNPYLAPSLGPDEFARRVLADLSEYPPYYPLMKERNVKAGPGDGPFWPWPRPVALSPAAVAERMADDHVVVDVRHRLAFGGGHIPDALGIGLDADLSPWTGWVVPYDRPLLLVVEGAHQVPEAVTRMARAGIDRIDGYLDGMDGWLTEARPVRSLPQLAPEEALDRARSHGLAVLDVRTDDEYRDGHIDGAIHVMAGHLPDRLDDGRGELPDPDAPIAVTCATGYRSTVAASILLRHGYRRVSNLSGGMTAWEAAGLPTVAD